MRDANQVMLTLLNTGGGVPTTGWLAQDLAGMNSPGFVWIDNIGATDTGAYPMTLSFTQGLEDGGGVFSVLSVVFEMNDGLFWYAGITFQEGH